eukprot:TRINITY_DN9767_c0_g1_i6.p1 TRINITY_DN9767_c0_g1~~TRINITY_DN9767_c0_g1_i6.p1  ORF type:complete len:387 (+),score=121.89 TRINITY_DN9767_c0_g1_i6:90-1250(+)
MGPPPKGTPERALYNEKDKARRNYDAELLTGRSFPSSSSSAGAGRSGPEVSAEDAFAAFAFAAAAAAAAGGGVGGTLGNFAEVLICAQQLARCRETGETPNAVTIASAGVALSTGLRVVGAAAGAAGLKGPAQALERGATVVQTGSQVLAASAIVAQMPGVGQALESGRAAATEKLQDFAEAAKKEATVAAQNLETAKEAAKEHAKLFQDSFNAGNASSSDPHGAAAGNATSTATGTATGTAADAGGAAASVAASAAALGVAWGGISAWAQRAKQHVTEKLAETQASAPPSVQTNGYPSGTQSASSTSARDLPTPSAAPPPTVAPESRIEVGTTVCLKGLKATPDLNGQSGEIVGFDETHQRYRVRVRSEVKLVRPECVEVEQMLD